MSEDKAVSKMIHVKDHFDGGFDLTRLLNNIRTGSGNVSTCISRLSSHSLAGAMLSWFVDMNLTATRHWFYTAARLRQAVYKRTQDKLGPMGKAFELLPSLVSNHPGLIRWFGDCDMVYDLERVEDVRTWDYLAYQAPLALRGDWKRLEQRSATALAYLQTTKTKTNYAPDQAFFLALARHDLVAMEAALEQLTQPRLVQSRSNDESGFTDDLIMRPAVIYAKIGWLHGHKIRVASPLVPAEWLPMEPLPRYEEVYPFLLPV